MLNELTSVQLCEWEAYDRLDPIGKWRDEYIIAQITSVITNIANAIYCEEGKQPAKTNAIDFLPVWDSEKRKDIQQEEKNKQSAEDMRMALMSIATVHNKKLQAKDIKNIRKRASTNKK